MSKAEKDAIASLSDFAGAFKAKKLSSQNITVKFSSKTEEEAKILSSSLVSVVGKNPKHLWKHLKRSGV